jgi:hypothetical protein
MTYAAPIARSTIKAAMVAWCRRATGLTTIWAKQDSPQPTTSYVSLEWIGGPKRTGRDAHESATDLTRAVAVAITPVAADTTTYTVTINGTGYSYMSGVGATVGSICAGIAPAITATGYTATNHTTHVDLRKNDGTVFILTVSPTANLTWTNTDEGHEVQTQTSGPRTLTLSINVFAAAGTDADAIMDLIEASIGDPDEVEARRVAGIGFHGTAGVNDLTFIAGPRFVGRKQLDVFCSVAFNLTTDRGYVETIAIDSTDLGWSGEEFGV